MSLWRFYDILSGTSADQISLCVHFSLLSSTHYIIEEQLAGRDKLMNTFSLHKYILDLILPSITDYSLAPHI